MPLPSGTRLGPYEIVAPIGAGGMGEVYRARDPKLNRDVAVKVLPAALADDADYLARFQREAQVLAALNHPNIAAIYGLEDKAIVMELVDGPTLDKRIAAGPVSEDEAIRIASQIAEALEAAHEKGIVHRDLKPGNIKITPEGAVKVLDFGLAKTAEASAANSASSPTLTLRATQAGLIMGTAGYMSPEQAAGKPVDKRADIWSFGVVLWEMLSGRQLFHGETVSHTLAHVLTMPIDLGGLPGTTPAVIRDLIRRCLERDAKARLRDIGEARIALQKWIANPAPTKEEPAKLPPQPRRILPWTIAAAAAVLAAGMIYLWQVERSRVPAGPVLRYTIAPLEKEPSRGFAISPDGRYLAVVGSGAPGQMLWVRALDSLQSVALPGTDGAGFPFWSPDSRFIAFFTADKLKKVAVTGGPSQTLCDAPNSRGGAWSRDGVILVAALNGTSLRRVSAAGGVAVEIKRAEEGNFRFPAFLPDGRRFLYTHRGGKEPGVFVASLDAKDERRLELDQSNAAYAPPFGSSRVGYVLFVREQTLMALPVHPTNIEPAGDVFPIAEKIAPQGTVTLNKYSISDTGVLVYETGSSGRNKPLSWFDRTGKQIENLGGNSSYKTIDGQIFALSPDGNRVIIERIQEGKFDLWLFDRVHNVESRLTFDGTSGTPIWSPDGSRIAFRSGTSLYVKAANGVGLQQTLFSSDVPMSLHDWSRDGKFLVFARTTANTRLDLYALPLGAQGDPAGKPIALVQTAALEWMGQLSPDGLWLAYVSDETGRAEVYVQPFAPNARKVASGKWQISSGGGTEPRWRADGKELFYIAQAQKLMAVDVKATSASFERGTPQPLFDYRVVIPGPSPVYHYAPSTDGKRFLMATDSPLGEAAQEVNVVVNWPLGLK